MIELLPRKVDAAFKGANKEDVDVGALLGQGGFNTVHETRVSKVPGLHELPDARPTSLQPHTPYSAKVKSKAKSKVKVYRKSKDHTHDYVFRKSIRNVTVDDLPDIIAEHQIISEIGKEKIGIGPHIGGVQVEVGKPAMSAQARGIPYSLFLNNPASTKVAAENIAQSFVEKICELNNMGLFPADIKPQNLVCWPQRVGTGQPCAGLIDLGTDFLVYMDEETRVHMSYACGVGDAQSGAVCAAYKCLTSCLTLLQLASIVSQQNNSFATQAQRATLSAFQDVLRRSTFPSEVLYLESKLIRLFLQQMAWYMGESDKYNILRPRQRIAFVDDYILRRCEVMGIKLWFGESQTDKDKALGNVHLAKDCLRKRFRFNGKSCVDSRQGACSKDIPYVFDPYMGTTYPCSPKGWSQVPLSASGREDDLKRQAPRLRDLDQLVRPVDLSIYESASHARSHAAGHVPIHHELNKTERGDPRAAAPGAGHPDEEVSMVSAMSNHTSPKTATSRSRPEMSALSAVSHRSDRSDGVPVGLVSAVRPQVASASSGKLSNMQAPGRPSGAGAGMDSPSSASPSNTSPSRASSSISMW
jgi:hypothetical protein